MAPTRKIGYAVVGLGSIAKSSVLPAFAHSKHAKLVAVVGRDKKKSEALALEFKAKAAYVSSEFLKCLANPAVEAVYIATPPGEHLNLLRQSARAGKHVLCEKPLAATVGQAQKMVDACRTNKVLLMTAYRKHFEPGSLYIKDLLGRGMLGRIDTIHTAFSELHVEGKSPAWLLDAKLAGGGPLTDLGVYCVNTTRFLLGEDPATVTAQSWRTDKRRYCQVEEGISFRFTFPSGVVAHGSSSYGAALSSILFIQGTNGWLSLSPAFPFDEERLLTGKIGGRWFEKKFEIVDEFAPEIDAMSKAILTHQPIQPDGVEGLRDMQIIRAIYDSAKKHKSIAIRY
jgi:predicted dehydrogenase